MSTFTPTTTVELRRCVTCGLEKRLTEFRRRRRGQPQLRSECRRCHNAQQREGRLRRAARKISSVAARIAQANADERARVVALASSLVGAFGGVQNLVTMYQRSAQSALANHPTSPATAMLLLAVLKLKVVSESIPTNDPRPESLERLHSELTREITSLIMSRPEELATLMREVGWKVQPPEASEQPNADND